MVVMMPDRKNEGGFLSRWSQRKQRIDAGEALDEDDLIVEDTAPEPALVEVSDADDSERELTAEELEMQENQQAAEEVDLETLEYSSDYSVFMKRGVSDAVKNAAMQKLWRSNPMLAVLDGLNDYDEDFGDPKLNIYKSIWKVKSGFLNEEELNHKPADKVQAVLDKLTKDAPAEIADEGDIEPVQDLAETTALEEPVAEDVIEIDVSDDSREDNADVVEYEEPKRVSLRSRIFEDADDAE